MADVLTALLLLAVLIGMIYVVIKFFE